MARSKKTSQEPVELEASQEVEVASEVLEKEFPYELEYESTGELLTVVAEGLDPMGRKTVITDTGCTYTV